MNDVVPSDLDLLTLSQLKQVASSQPQPYRVHVQVDMKSERTASTGSPFLEIKLADSGDSLTWRLFDNNPLFRDAGELKRGVFIELAAQWIDTGKYGMEPKQAQMRLLSDEERETLLNGDPTLLEAEADEQSRNGRALGHFALRSVDDELHDRVLHPGGGAFNRCRRPLVSNVPGTTSRRW